MIERLRRRHRRTWLLLLPLLLVLLLIAIIMRQPEATDNTGLATLRDSAAEARP